MNDIEKGIKRLELLLMVFVKDAFYRALDNDAEVSCGHTYTEGEARRYIDRRWEAFSEYYQESMKKAQEIELEDEQTRC